uniref:Zn(2)-C6 fungal-type domain-containing protein n=1 Tax=Mycena chlorophos TaxID=658473 RepID=A0ABQ0L056_MYCCL|nr:predicted protein [Mycena chlorophos]
MHSQHLPHILASSLPEYWHWCVRSPQAWFKYGVDTVGPRGLCPRILHALSQLNALGTLLGPLVSATHALADAHRLLELSTAKISRPCVRCAEKNIPCSYIAVAQDCEEQTRLSSTRRATAAQTPAAPQSQPSHAHLSAHPAALAGNRTRMHPPAGQLVAAAGPPHPNQFPYVTAYPDFPLPVGDHETQYGPETASPHHDLALGYDGPLSHHDYDRSPFCDPGSYLYDENYVRSWSLL